ncbi:amino acid adenylation domain-containing protein, partial [Streptomyces seoulensis]
MRGRDGDGRLLDDLFAAQAARTPGATALVCRDARLTFAELDTRVAQLAVLLAGHGVRPETPVALCLERGPDLIAGTLAVLRAGGVLVPLDPGHPAQRLAQLLADSGALLVLTDREAGRPLPAHGPDRLYTDEADGPGGAGRPGGAGSPGGGADRPGGTGPGPGVPVRPLPANAACLMYTSGSSGRPKGVVIPHANLVNLHLDYLARCVGPTVRAAGGRRLRVAHTLPAAFDASWAPLMWLVAGHELHVVDSLTRDDPEALADLCARSRLDVLDDTPSRLRLLLRAGLLSGGGHRPLDVTAGGEALDTALCAELAGADGVVCRNTYGPTEATVDALSWRVRPGAGPLIGRPVAGARERVLDRELRPVAAGETGELWLAGPGIARGYHGRPGWTARSFTADPFGPPGSRMYRTGDLVRRQADGQLEFMGRSDDQVKISGARVEPREVEAALERHPGVERAVVVGATRSDGRPFLAAYAVLSPAHREAEAYGAEAPARRETKAPDAEAPDAEAAARRKAETPDAEAPARREAKAPDTDAPAHQEPETPGPAALRAFLAAVLPRHALPAALVVLDRLPLLPGGKVDRRALPPARPGSDRAPVPPRTADERLLAGVWERVLRVERVGVHDDFLALGGDSILAMQIVSEVRRSEEAAGRMAALRARALFDHPTIATLAAALDAGRAADAGQRRPGPAPAPAAPVTRRPHHGRTLPLSPAQRRLWYLAQLRPESTEYNTATGFRLRGDLDAAALGAALDALAARHEPLRTTFHTVDGEGVQRVGAPRPVPVGTVDLTGLPEADRAAAEDRAVREELGRAFDLEHGPPLRVLVVRRDADDHLLVLHQHHLVTDGWSVGVLTEELGALYSAALRGERARLPPLALRYTDHAVRQAERAAAPEREASLAHWRRRLAGLVPLELPTDRPRPAVRTAAGAVHRFLVPAELTARLTEVGRAVGATPFMVLTAALHVLLARTCGRQDIALATVLSGRDRVELEPLAGFFAHTVVLRSQADPALPFDGFLRAVRSTVLDAFTHGEVPYDEVVRAVRPERDASRSPLAQVALVLQNAPRPGLRMAGLRAEDAELPGLTSLFDMTWEFEPRQGALAGTVQYDTDLFDPATPARLADRLGVLLAGIADDPGRPLDRLPLLPAAEARQLARWSAGEAADLPETTVHALVAEQARLRPGAVALSYGDTRLTYAELAARAERLAAALGAHGAGPGSVVGVLLERGADLVVSLLAVLRSGAAYLPLDPGDPAGRSAFLLADS